MNPVLASLLAASAGLALASPAVAAVGDWGQGQRAQARLLASGVDADGRLSAAVEIVLPGGWRTYWRNPGDAGVPPVIDLSASRNVANPMVDFPVPVREDEGDDVVDNVYRDRVVLPISAVVPDRKRPAELSIDLKLGVCQEVCVPDEVTASLTIDPGATDAAAGAAIATARAAVPGAPVPGTFALDKVTREGGTDGHPVFRFEGVVPDAARALLFIEAPEGWAPYTPEFQADDSGRASYLVKFSRLGSPVPIAGAKFRVTISSGKRAIDQTLTPQ
jgi:DsbC/DsbD-like thiol-disulfide interchange protein